MMQSVPLTLRLKEGGVGRWKLSMINTMYAVFSTASKSHFFIALSYTISVHISNNVAHTAAQMYSNNL